MRLKPDEVDFAKYLLQLGNGTTPVHSEIGEDMVKIPQQYLVDSTDELIDKVFPELENGYMDKYFVSHRAILTPLNDNVDKINEVIMAKFPGEGKTYLSADSVADEDMANTYPTDFLNSVHSVWHASSCHDTKGWSTCDAAMKPEGWPWIWPSQWHKDDCFDTWSKSS